MAQFPNPAVALLTAFGQWPVDVLYQSCVTEPDGEVAGGRVETVA